MSPCFRSPVGVGHWDFLVVIGSDFVCSVGAFRCDGKGKDEGFSWLCIAAYHSLKTGKEELVKCWKATQASVVNLTAMLRI